MILNYCRIKYLNTLKIKKALNFRAFHMFHSLNYLLASSIDTANDFFIDYIKAQ